jgi:hypothetical protein
MPPRGPAVDALTPRLAGAGLSRMRIVALVVSLLVLVGCAPPLPPIALATAPRPLTELTLYVEDEAALAGDMVDENKSLATSIPAGVSGALTRAGYQVVTNKGRPHDAVVRLSADVTSVPSIFVVKVDGRVLKDAVARVRLAIEADGIRIDEVEATTPGGNPTKPDALDRVTIELVNGVSRSLRLARLAEKGKPGVEVAQKNEPRAKPGAASSGEIPRLPGGAEPLVVVNVEAPGQPALPKTGSSGPPSPPSANSAEKPKPGTAPNAGTAKPKSNSQPSVGPQTTSR